MLEELAKPIALVLCVLALFAVFYVAFIAPAIEVQQRISDSALLLFLSAGVCLSSGMIFREPGRADIGALVRTLPVQMFLWAAGVMVLMFVASWYLEQYGIFYKDVRRF